MHTLVVTPLPPCLLHCVVLIVQADAVIQPKNTPTLTSDMGTGLFLEADSLLFNTTVNGWKKEGRKRREGEQEMGRVMREHLGKSQPTTHPYDIISSSVSHCFSLCCVCLCTCVQMLHLWWDCAPKNMFLCMCTVYVWTKKKCRC